MTEREIIIEGLERRQRFKTPDGSSCVIPTNLLQDALILLKAQEPRVMTLEEALGGDECWIEGRSGACGYGDALLTDDGERVDFYRPHSINTLDFYEYGLSWRCWTSRPDEKVRAETPWADN